MGKRDSFMRIGEDWCRFVLGIYLGWVFGRAGEARNGVADIEGVAG
jgi:hypothetical protein